LKNFFKDYKNLTMVIEDLPQFHVLLLKMADVHWPKLVVEHLEEVAILYALLTKESESSETYVEIANLLGGGTSLARYLVKLDHFKFKCVHWDFERELKELKKVDFEKAEKMPFFQFLCEMKGIVPLKDSLQRILDHDKVSLNIGEKLKFFDRLQLHHLRGGEKFLNTVERERIDGPRRNSLKIFIHLNE